MDDSLQIQQFRYGSDNFAYLIHGEQSALAIDGGAVEEILGFTAAKHLNLAYIVHTHNHADHTVGTQRLLDLTGATRLSPDEILKDKVIQLDSKRVHVHHTPGHTEDSLVFYANNFLVTGDTLFNGTVVNCFSGDLRAFYHSISHLLTFSDETFSYAGHDYVSDSMRFAQMIEPGNDNIQTYLNKYDPRRVVSTLADEKKVNPYLRFNTPDIVAVLKKRGLPTDSPYHCWESLMSIE